ncbi:hypothetical protein NM688_g4732 [Phlebia brevispora]|uniref:Uncharacterized protein n=1 Tax=Phlebia brevispora TaxID=194682 RepID=A0ACC1T2A9_9APHY|nr:hypothetical protein NM688_g4732 [Phlebia brevispora]
MDALYCRVPADHRRSPIHYYEDGTLFVQAGNVMFRVSEAMLCGRAPALRQVLLRRRQHGPAGRDEEHPVVIDDVEADELNHFFTFLWGKSSNQEPQDADPDAEEEEPGVDGLMAILRLSVLFRVKGGKRYAVRRLEMHEDFSEAQRLMMGLECDVAGWFESALRWLINWPTSQWTAEEMEVIDKGIFAKILALQHEINVHHHFHAFHPHSPITTCEWLDSNHCTAAWAKTWAAQAAHLLTDPDRCDVSPLAEAIMSMRTSNADMCSSCRTAHLLGLEHLLSQDGRAIEGLIEALKEEYNVD